MSYFVGQVAGVKGTVTKKATKEPVDPDKMVATVIPPSGEAEVVEGKKVSEGVYEWEVPVTEPGKWELIGDGIGGHDTADNITWRAEHRNAPRPT